MLDTIAVQLSDVSKRYTPQGPPALERVSLVVRRGEFVAVKGKSGSGKTTLLNLLAGLDRPTDGAVRVAGQNLGAMSEAKLAVWRGRHVGVVFQFFQLLPTLSAIENVVLPMEFTGSFDRQKRVERARRLLGDVGLEDHWHKWPATLSGGQQQRVALARALANDPVLVLADEPTGNLDSDSAEQVFRSLVAAARGGTTVVMITHDADAAALTDRVVVLADGRIVADRRTGAA